MVATAQYSLLPAREFRAERPALSITCLGSDPDILVDLTTARTAFEAEMIAESLRAQGIPAEAFTAAGSMLQWDIAATQPMRIQVRRRDLERASSVLRAIRAESVDIDWSEVETGDQTVVSEDERRRLCGRCGYDLTAIDPSAGCPGCAASPLANTPVPTRFRYRTIAHALVIYAALLLLLEPAFYGSVVLLASWTSPLWWSWYYSFTGHLLVWIVAAFTTWLLLRARG